MKQGASRRPRCPQCGSTSLTLIELHHGAGMWDSGEWTHHPDGTVTLDGDGWSESSPTGRWELRCEDCDHQWTKRGAVDVRSDHPEARP